MHEAAFNQMLYKKVANIREISFFMPDSEGNTSEADDSRLVNNSLKPHRLLNSSNLKYNLVNLWEL